MPGRRERSFHEQGRGRKTPAGAIPSAFPPGAVERIAGRADAGRMWRRQRFAGRGGFLAHGRRPGELGRGPGRASSGAHAGTGATGSAGRHGQVRSPFSAGNCAAGAHEGAADPVGLVGPGKAWAAQATARGLAHAAPESARRLTQAGRAGREAEGNPAGATGRYRPRDHAGERLRLRMRQRGRPQNVRTRKLPGPQCGGGGLLPGVRQAADAQGRMQPDAGMRARTLVRQEGRRKRKRQPEGWRFR